jgi:hypothetical protein
MSVRIYIGNLILSLILSHLNCSDVLKAIRMMFDDVTKQLIPVCSVPIHLLYNSCHLDVSDIRKKAASLPYNYLTGLQWVGYTDFYDESVPTYCITEFSSYAH